MDGHAGRVLHQTVGREGFLPLLRRRALVLAINTLADRGKPVQLPVTITSSPHDGVYSFLGKQDPPHPPAVRSELLE